MERAFWCCHQPKSCPHEMGKVDTNECEWPKGEWLKLPSNFTIPPQLRLRSAAPPQAVAPLGSGTICQDIGVNALVGTRSSYSLPFVILPVPARSPFRFIRHRRRSTPNPASGGAFMQQASHEGRKAESSVTAVLSYVQ